jgi:dinuclear metal center YbgI/SA1388 family protein
MAVELQTLLKRAQEIMQPDRFSDYCPNGLQVEGRGKIQKLVTGVTASMALIEAAVDAGADAILVHHGFFWRGENPCIKGVKRPRIRQLLLNDINLIAYHLPLDGHMQLGNNVQLAARLGLVEVAKSPVRKSLLVTARLPEAQTAAEWAAGIEKVLGRTPQFIGEAGQAIERVALGTGAAQDFFEEAIELGVDAFLTGEISEQSVHLARESGKLFFAAGHHATERYGVQALGALLAEEFELEHQFIDIDNPV